MFAVQWPEPGRFIHNRATKVKMIVTKGDGLPSGTGMADRPSNGGTSQVRISDLPADEPLRFEVWAEDSVGTRLSAAILSDQKLKPGPNTLAFTLDSVVDSIEITPANPTVAVGSTLQLSAVGKNGAATVLTSSDDFVWSSSTPLVATVGSAGKVIGTANGTATITAREVGNDSTGRTATVQVKVGTGETGGGRYHLTDLGTLGGTIIQACGVNASGQVVGFSGTVGDSAYHAFLYSDGAMRDIGTLGGTESFARGINASGQVVGSSSLAGNSGTHAFLYSGGAMRDLGTLGGRDSEAYGVNASGQIVGNSWVDASNFHAFSYSDGAMRDLGTLGGTISQAYGVNLSGQVVGSAQTASGDRAFLYSDGSMRDLGTPGGTDSVAYGVNASGQIVGHYLAAAGGEHAFLYVDGAMRDLGTLGGAESVAFGINASGQVVGVTYNAGVLHAFLYSDGTLRDLNGLLDASGTGWVITQARGISDNGLIAATATNSAGKQHAVLLTPVQ